MACSHSEVAEHHAYMFFSEEDDIMTSLALRCRPNEPICPPTMHVLRSNAANCTFPSHAVVAVYRNRCLHTAMDPSCTLSGRWKSCTAVIYVWATTSLEPSSMSPNSRFTGCGWGHSATATPGVIVCQLESTHSMLKLEDDARGYSGTVGKR